MKNLARAIIATIVAVALGGCTSPSPPARTSLVKDPGPTCFIRSTTATYSGNPAKELQALEDIRPMLTLVSESERKCSVTVRAQYKGKWEDIYGDSVGAASMDVNALCVAAVENASKQFLASKETSLTSAQQMVCTDEPPIKTRPVEKGEVIRISEVLPHPAKPRAFTYRGTECKMFIEHGVRNNMLYDWQGVACKTGRNGGDEWTVLEKF